MPVCTETSSYETTLNGHLIDSSAAYPIPAKIVELDGARLEVIAGDDTQITQVAVRSAPRPPDPNP